MILRRPFRIKKRKKIYQRTVFLGFCFFASFSIFVFNLFCLTDFFDIKKIEILGTKELNPQVLAAQIFVLSQGKILFLPKKMEEKLLEKFLEIEKVKVSIFPQKVKVEILEKEPQFNFCKKENCFLVSKEGILYKRGKRKELLLLEKENFEPALGKKLEEKETLEKILQLKEKVSEILPIEKANIEDLQKVTFFSKETQIYFSLEKNLHWQTTKLKALFEREFSLEDLKKIEYIDVRFGNFANFKFKNQ